MTSEHLNLIPYQETTKILNAQAILDLKKKSSDFGRNQPKIMAETTFNQFGRMRRVTSAC